MGNVRRIYVEKKEPYAVKAKELHDELKIIWASMWQRFVSLSAMMWRIFRMRCLQEPARLYFRASRR